MKRAETKGFEGRFVSVGYIAAILILTAIALPGSKALANQWRTVQMKVTAYCPCEKCCGEHSDGITASGHKIAPGDVFVAADKTFAFGTEIVIAGYANDKPVKVLDRGGAIKGNKLDVFFPTHQQALDWGVKYVEIKVLTK